VRAMSNGRRNQIVWQPFRLERGEFFLALLKFSQSQAKFLLSFCVNV
jgi:hypothetical protein